MAQQVKRSSYQVGDLVEWIDGSCNCVSTYDRFIEKGLSGEVVKVNGNAALVRFDNNHNSKRDCCDKCLRLIRAACAKDKDNDAICAAESTEKYDAKYERRKKTRREYRMNW